MNEWISLIDGDGPDLPNNTWVETKGGYCDDRIVKDYYYVGATASGINGWMNQPGDPTHWRPIEQQTMKTIFKPAGDRVLIKLDAVPDKQNGLYLPDSVKASDIPQTGVVEATGPGKQDSTVAVFSAPFRKGDKVLVSKYGGLDIVIDDEKFKLFKFDDILGKFVSAPEASDK